MKQYLQQKRRHSKTHPPRWIGLFLLFGFLPLTYFAQGEDLADRQGPTFRLNLLQNIQVAPHAQKAPYAWSGVYLRNAFDNQEDLAEFRLDSSMCGVGVLGTQQFGDEIKVYYAYDSEGQINEVHYKQKVSAGLYENFSRKLFTYTDGKRVRYLYQFWNSATSGWDDEYEEVSSYNTQGEQETFMLREKDMTGQWKNLLKETRVFDVDGNIIEVLAAKWNNNSWLDTARKEISYNEIGFYTEIYEEAWNGSGWDTLSKESALYGSNGMTWQGYLFQQKNAGNFENVLRERYAYDTYGYWTGMTRELWNNQSSAWENDTKESYEYTRKGIWIGWTQQVWENNAWVNRTRQRYSPNSSLRIDLRQSWDTNAGEWVNAQRMLAGYDSDFNLEREAGTQSWNASINDWENTAESRNCIHFWSEPTATSVRPKLPLISCDLANPYRAYSPISCDALQAGKEYQLRITDMQGRIVIDKSIPGGNEFSIQRSLPVGVYNLNIFEDKRVRYARKVLIRN